MINTSQVHLKYIERPANSNEKIAGQLRYQYRKIAKREFGLAKSDLERKAVVEVFSERMKQLVASK